jgi:hypothetical protein
MTEQEKSQNIYLFFQKNYVEMNFLEKKQNPFS